MNGPAELEGRPPKSIAALEKRAKLRYDNKVWYQLGLRRFIIATNIIGLALAVILATKGMAILVAISIGVLCGFFLPGIVLLFICATELKARYFGKTIVPLASEIRKMKPKPTASPFDD